MGYDTLSTRIKSAILENSKQTAFGCINCKEDDELVISDMEGFSDATRANPNTMNNINERIRGIVESLPSKERKYSREDMIKCWNASHLRATAYNDDPYSKMPDFIELLESL